MKVELGIYAILYGSFMTVNMHFKILLNKLWKHYFKQFDHWKHYPNLSPFVL